MPIRPRPGISTLTVLVGDEPPSEFRIFAAGWNDTENGYRVLFDEAAASAVIAAYRKHGVDRMIDLEHLSLDPHAPNYDPDARGWSGLEVRRDAQGQPELWAVNVRWTPDGAARLTEKRQRYMSPAFLRDEKSGRVVKVINIAITALPASHATTALMAASIQGSTMPTDDIKAAIKAMKEGDGDSALAVLEAMLVAAASGEEAAPPAEEAAPEMSAEAVETPAEDEEEKKEPMAAAASILRLTGKSTHVEALSEVEAWRESHIKLEAERSKLATERAVLESSERRRLVSELVKLGAEIPATAWADDKATKPCKRLASEPLAELRDRVRALSTGRAAVAAAGPRSPNSVPEVLSARELAMCAAKKIDPAKYLATRAAIAARNVGRRAQENS